MTPDEPRVALREEPDGRVVRLVFEAPPENAFDLRLTESFLSALNTLSGWSDVSCVILEGAGRDFSTGLLPAHRRAPYVSSLLPNFHAAVRSLASLDAVLVANVRGRCFGAGAELLLLCDAVFADGTARLSFPDIGMGAFSPMASLLLPARIGPLRARQWLLSGSVLPPDEAAAAGLLTGLASGWDSLATITQRFLEQHVLPHSVVALRASARALRLPLLSRLNEELGDLEELFLKRIAESADAEEGLDAAQQKREPQWKHR